MIYQRHINDEDLFSAQLELLMQNGRVASMGSNMIGVLAVVAMVWPYFDLGTLLAWAFAVLALLLARSMHMSSALTGRTYQSSPTRVFWVLIMGSMVTGAIWSVAYIFLSQFLPPTLQYILLLVIVMITTISLAVMVVVREYFIAFLFTSLWPIAWWSLAHIWDQPHNLLIGSLILGVCVMLLVVSSWIHDSFRSMISLSWERETMSRELGDLTGSLRDRNRQLKEARRQLTDLANVDELTGLGNRRLVNSVLQQEINRARRNGSQLSLILIDVDFFKNYNDTYGHSAGDEVLRRLGEVMRKATSRAGEVVARYGGEEFILILPGANQGAALRTAERLKALIFEENMHHGSSQVSDRITVSQGVLTVAPTGEIDPVELIDKVDAALYEAKHKGRNMVVAV